MVVQLKCMCIQFVYKLFTFRYTYLPIDYIGFYFIQLYIDLLTMYMNCRHCNHFIYHEIDQLYMSCRHYSILFGQIKHRRLDTLVLLIKDMQDSMSIFPDRQMAWHLHSLFAHLSCLCFLVFLSFEHLVVRKFDHVMFRTPVARITHHRRSQTSQIWKCCHRGWITRW